MSRDIFKACRILFGTELDYSLDFLYYLQSSGIKSAYRKRALETHPDTSGACASKDDSEKGTDADDFIETHWAYQRLIEFIGSRDSHMLKRHHPLRYPASVAQPLRHRHKRRARRPAASGASTEGYFYKSAMPRRRLMLGEYLFYSGRVSWESLIKAIVWQRRQRPRFGEMAVHLGWATHAEVIDGFRNRRMGEPIGQSLLRLGHLNQQQLDSLLRRQRDLHRPIGEFFVTIGQLTPQELGHHLRDLKKHNEKQP